MYINKIGDEVYFILECKVLCNLISFLFKVIVFLFNVKWFCEIMILNNYVILKKNCVCLLKILIKLFVYFIYVLFDFNNDIYICYFYVLCILFYVFEYI